MDLKIAILSDFPVFVIPEFGDAYRPQGHYATWLPQLVRAFAGYPDLEIHWLTLSRAVSSPRTISWSGQTFHVLPAGKMGRRAPTLYYHDRQALAACLRDIQPELVHGWGTEDVYALAAVSSGYPNIVSMQGILSHYVRKAVLGLRGYLQTLLELFVLFKADSVTVESEWGRGKLLRRNPAMKVDVIEYGVDDHFLETAWQPDPQRPAALFVGSLVSPKGIQDLVAAYADPVLASTELWIAGSGIESWVEPLRSRSTPNVKWLGRCSRSDIGSLMSRAWCLALPTRADTSPNVVKEARAIGLPLITTPCGGQAAYVEEGKNGFLVAPGDIEALIKALQIVLANFDRCREMGAYLHREHREFLHPKQTAQKFVDLYRKRLGSP